jgi:hypothetical protein
MPELECGHEITRGAYGYPDMNFVTRLMTLDGKYINQYEVICAKCGHKEILQEQIGG